MPAALRPHRDVQGLRHVEGREDPGLALHLAADLAAPQGMRAPQPSPSSAVDPRGVAHVDHAAQVVLQ